MNEPSPPRYVVSTALFLRLVAICFAIAFASLGVQVAGLVGERGLEPAREFLDAISRMGGGRAFLAAPSIFWLGASDAALKGACVAGLVASGLLAAGVFQGPMLLACWALYLSLCSVGGDFLGFQWDGLLLETAFLAMFLAPWTWRPGAWKEREPSPLALWLLRFLLFRLMLSSGLVKLASGDPSWRNLSALAVHYETQPLPTWIGFFAHQLPRPVQVFSCLALFAIELVSPWMVFLSAKFRRIAGALFIALMVIIGLTGNYTFFGLLTCALSVLLFDDALFPAAVRARVRVLETPQKRAVRALAAVGAAAWLVVSVDVLVGTVTRPSAMPGPLTRLELALAPFRTINRYGLFAVMTTTRAEIVIEGSDDREHWREYVFPWKPQFVGVRPRFVEPHQPRLDWQLWFAALGQCEDNEWFITLLQRLQSGAPEVATLLAENPFPEHGPKYVRSTLWEYRFTTLAEWRATGNWWKRTEIAPYCPVLARPGP